MSILVFLFPIVGPLLLWLLFILARAFRGWDDRFNADVRAESHRRIRAQRLSLDTQVPSPMLRRIQHELYPEKVAAQKALNKAKSELVEAHDRAAEVHHYN